MHPFITREFYKSVLQLYIRFIYTNMDGEYYVFVDLLEDMVIRLIIMLLFNSYYMIWVTTAGLSELSDQHVYIVSQKSHEPDELNQG